MHSKKTRTVLVFATLLILSVVIGRLLPSGKQNVQTRSAALPLGLLLEQLDGNVTVVEAKNNREPNGFHTGDVIKSIDGQKVASVAELRSLLSGKQDGQMMRIVVARGGKMVPMNREHHERMEIATARSIATSQITPSTPQPPVGTTASGAVSANHVIDRMTANFGMEFAESGGRLRVTTVDPISASHAYGIRPDDILFQVDSQRITSLNDFQLVARGKVTGDVANLMIVRGENIVLIQDMKLAAKGEKAVAPVGYVATIHPFSSLKQEALERLLASPFQFNPQDTLPLDSVEPPTASFVINTDVEESITELATEKGNELAKAAEQLDSLIDDAVQTVDQVTRFRTSSTTQESKIVDADSKSTIVEDPAPVRVADVTNRLRKPSAKPRFNISGARLPELGGEDVVKTVEEIARDFVAESSELTSTTTDLVEANASETAENAATTSKNHLRDTVASLTNEAAETLINEVEESKNEVTEVVSTSTSTDELADRFSDLASDDWSSSRRHRGATDYLAGTEPNRFVDRGTTLKIASEPGETQVINRIRVQAEAVATATDDVITPEPAVPAQETKDPFVRDGEPESVVKSSTDIPDQSVVHESEVQFMDSAAPAIPATTIPAESMLAPLECETCQPALGMAPSCTQCNDWGCSSCRWAGHGCFSLNNLLYGNAQPVVSLGGWFSLGYHSQSNDLFNDRPDNVNLHQGWLYAEKAATECSPLGFRADVVYGIDGADTQAFGNSLGTWDFDNGFDFGAYSWAIPQLYVELMVRDWNIKAGHFFTIAGYETVTAPDNFFYSHAMTMYNSEPFTHTGVLASKALTQNLEVYAGWTLGWDTGFDQLNGGSSWLGGFNYSPVDDISFTYVSTAGNLGSRGDDAYSHSMVLDLALTNSLTYVVQSDLLRVDATGEDNIGINQYLLYNVSNTLGVGARLEWWKGDVLSFYAPHGGVLPASGSLSYYAATFGVNYKPRANFITRPEIRYDWSPAAGYDEVYFGIDAILSF